MVEAIKSLEETNDMNHLENKQYTLSDLKRIREENPKYSYELIDGQIYMMGYTSIDHCILVNSIATILNIQFKGKPCRVVSENLGVKIDTRKNYVLPDILVVCGKINRNDTEISNPSLIVEVLSSSTEKGDRGDKLEGYMFLNSLKAYLIVDKYVERIEVYRKINNEIIYKSFTSGQTIEIDDWVKIPVDEVYEDLNFSLGLKDSENRY